MLTQEQVLEAIQHGRESECFDGRDYVRLAVFFDESAWSILNVNLREGEVAPERLEWTEANVKRQLESDLDFAFEKALDQRGISAGLMHETIKTWLWVLEDPLQHMDNYTYYGLPLFRAVAEKYGFANPIGDKQGNEREFSEDCYD